MGLRARLFALGVVLIAASFGTSCNLDPVHRATVDGLGAEDPTFPPGPYHRPGQPCAACHSDKGPADGVFEIAGTVFWDPESKQGVDGAYVRILDGTQSRYCFVTNCNGNFFARPEQFRTPLTFPILVSVERATTPGQDESTLILKRMSGHIGRERSCATCHQQPYRDWASPGSIYLFKTPQEVKEKHLGAVDCPPTSNAPIDKCPENR